jgi:anaerobic magnesium-protoporphyrin IX monomethyl ester cyclase
MVKTSAGKKEEASIRVVLIRPPIVQLPKSLSCYGAVLPIGLAYIAAALESAGHRVTAIDAPGEALGQIQSFASPVGRLERLGLSAKEVVARVPNDAEVVGITNMFLHEWPEVLVILEELRKELPNAMLVLGGENASAFWPHIFSMTSLVDAVVVGEGEETIVELAAAVASGHSLQGISGLVWREEFGSVVEEQARARIRSIDSITQPAWHLFPIEAYLEADDMYGVNRGRSMPVLGSRGCPYLCTFCSSPKMWEPKYIPRSPAALVDEISGYVSKFGVQNVNFCDLTAITKRKWIVEFCELMIEADLGVVWQLPTGTRSEVLDRPVLELLFKAGCRNITYNPESGSERMLSIYKKRVKVDKLVSSLESAGESGLNTRVCFIVGHPKENVSDIVDSAKLLVKLAIGGVHDVSVMMFSPFPGSEDFDEMEAAGDIEFGPEFYYLALSRGGVSRQGFHPTLSNNKLLTAQWSMMLMFYSLSYLSHPRRIADNAKAIVLGKEETALDQFLRIKARQIQRYLRFA